VPLFAAEDLACLRGGQLVFAGLGFALEEGELLVLRGPNGSGKSTLLRLLAGLLPRREGRLWWRGRTCEPQEAAHRARLHYVGHHNAVKSDLTAAENLAFHAALYGGGERVDRALAAFGLSALGEMRVRYLSAGQRRRLALARLLLAPRPLWLLDEPEVGLDRPSRKALAKLLEDHLAGGGVAVVATHGDPLLPPALVLELGA